LSDYQQGNLGTAVPAVLLVPGKADTPNVVCESALQQQHLKHHTPKLKLQLSAAELETEYGPMTRTIRLAPPPAELERTRKDLQDQRETKHQERKRKQQHKKKKRKREIEGGEEKKEPESDRTASASVVSVLTSTSTVTTPHKVTVGGAARSRVDTAIQSNKVLSSLFTNSSENNNKKKVSEKEHKDNLFAR
jgi:hypothetical protein